jgi:glycosyltransferase involved in cell wall biosynthesis
MRIMIKIAIVIPTRNRPKHLTRLLDSIAKGTTLPEQVVVVSSGDDVASLLWKYRNILKITHLHIKEKGQIRQKMAAVSLLKNDIDWVFFSDDDLLFQSSTLSDMKLSIQYTEKHSPVGIGVHITHEHSYNRVERQRCVSRFFHLTTKGYGCVDMSGLNSSYLDSKELCRTEWLNGASLWQASFAKSYKFEFLDARYSIYEDLIFSYPIGKLHCLLFDPSIKLSFQHEITADVSSRMIFASKCYWRLYFVKKNPEMSLLRFFWTQIGITLQQLEISYKKKTNFFSESFFVLKLLADTVILSLSRANPLEILEKRLKDKTF